MSGLIVDIFAGGGGASVGITRAMGRHVDLGINHDWDALRTHHVNHRLTRHMVDDIRSIVPVLATGGARVELLWASPDCRHFSRAKGGKPCHPEVRELPWNVVRWAEQTRPRLICVENVPEMVTWGPLHEDHDVCALDDDTACPKSEKGCHWHRPIAARTGETWAEWVQAFRDAGYKVAWWVLHAHHYGAPTSRKRMFFVARNDGLEPVCPPATHGPGMDPYRTAAECIDWSDLGESIFDADGNTRHAKATLRRIATGVMRYVVQAKQPFIVTCNHGKEGFRGQALTDPFKTITASQDAHGLVVPTLIATGYGERAGQAPRVHDIQEPHPTCVAGGIKSRLVTAFLAKHYGGVVGTDARVPLGTITATDHHSVVSADLERLEAARRGPLVAAFLSTYYGQSVGRAIDEPMATLTTKDRHALVTVEIDGVTYAIVDIRMRMLKPSELKLAQGFPLSYVLEGSAKLQVRLIGNSVPPQLSEAVVRANTPGRCAPLREAA